MIWLFLVVLSSIISTRTLSDNSITKLGGKVDYNSLTVPARATSLLVIVPGFGFHPARTATVLRNLQIIQETDFPIDCLIYTYGHHINVSVLYLLQETCDVRYYHNANYASCLKTITPSMVTLSNYSHVMVLLDDVELSETFSFKGIIKIMQRNQLHVVTPAVQGAALGSTSPYQASPMMKKYRMKRPEYSVGHYAMVVEIFATIFTSSGWDCFWHILEPQWNPRGWGYDLCLHQFCRDVRGLAQFSMGVVQSMKAIHHIEYGRVAHAAASVAGVWNGYKWNKSNSTSELTSPQALSQGQQKDLWLSELLRVRNLSLQCSDASRHSRGRALDHI